MISTKDSQRAAERFVGMLRDDVYLQVVLGLRPLGEAEIARVGRAGGGYLPALALQRGLVGARGARGR